MHSKSAGKDLNNNLGSTLGFLSLRFWLATRAIMTGVEKYSAIKGVDETVMIDGAANTYGLTATAGEKVYGLSHYHGIPKVLMDQFMAEPMIPESLLRIYSAALGPLLIILGITLLFGIASRISLFLMGLLYTSLTVGLILLKQDAGIAWLAVHVLMIAVALFNAQHDRFALLRKW